MGIFFYYFNIYIYVSQTWNLPHGYLKKKKKTHGYIVNEKKHDIMNVI